MSKFSGRLLAVLRYAQEMRTPSDWYRYARLRAMYYAGSPSRTPRAIALRSLGGASVLCRPSRDVWTLKYTFIERYHLPPVAIPETATIVDLGCNVGYTVAHLAHVYPRARIIGVEMDQRNMELARLNTRSLGNRVTLVHAAVWSEDGEVSYGGEEDDSFQVLGARLPASVLHAPAMRLTSILGACGVEHVDYLKVDIEGAETALLADVNAWAGRVRSLKVEVHPPAILDTCRAVLEGGGFTCENDSRHPSCVSGVRNPGPGS